MGDRRFEGDDREDRRGDRDLPRPEAGSGISGASSASARVDIDARIAIEAWSDGDSIVVMATLRVEVDAERGDCLVFAFPLPVVRLSVARTAVPVGFGIGGMSGAFIARLIGDQVCGRVEATIWGTPFETSEACVTVGAAPDGQCRLQRRA